MMYRPFHETRPLRRGSGGMDYANTNTAGQVKVNLIVDVDARDAYIRATLSPRDEYAADATAYFRPGVDPDPVKLVVLPPQETLYSVEASPPMKEDGLLRDLPKGFDETWLHPD